MVTGEPLPLGAFGGPDDADVLALLHRQVVLASLGCHGDHGLVHGLLLTCDLHQGGGQRSRGSRRQGTVRDDSSILYMMTLVYCI